MEHYQPEIEYIYIYMTVCSGSPANMAGYQAITQLDILWPDSLWKQTNNLKSLLVIFKYNFLHEKG